MDFLEISLNNQTYLLDSSLIKMLVHYTKPELLAGSSKYIEGIMNHQDKVIPILSLRKLLGFQSFKDAQITFLHDVEEQHVQWVKSFEHTLLTGDKFKKTLDPHKCALGVWIDERLRCLKCNNNGYIDILKKEVIEQHKALHKNGAACLINDKLTMDQKLEKINSNANETIQGLGKLRDNIDKLTSAFEQMIIFEVSGIEFGLIVDNIEKNHHLQERNFFTSTKNLSPNSQYIQFIDHYKIDEKIMFSINFTDSLKEIIQEFKSTDSNA